MRKPMKLKPKPVCEVVTNTTRTVRRTLKLDEDQIKEALLSHFGMWEYGRVEFDESGYGGISGCTIEEVQEEVLDEMVVNHDES